jgi:hypothetical protein
MYTIKKAFIEIDIDEYLEKLSKYQGYIDAADSMREPNDTYKVDSFDSLKHAEREIDTDVVLTIDSDQVTIEYYYIDGSDKVYFTHVLYENKRYPIDEDLYSKSCYRAILKDLDLDDQPKNLRESRIRRVHESSKDYNNGSAHYGRISYLWSMEDEFEMTDGLNNKIQKVMLGSPKAFFIEKLEKVLSEAFDTKVNLITCNIRPDSFALSFIGKKVFLSIVVNY